MELWSGEPRVRGTKDVCKVSSHPPGIHQVSELLKATQHSAQVSEGAGCGPIGAPSAGLTPQPRAGPPNKALQASAAPQLVPPTLRTQETSPVVSQTPFLHTSLRCPPHPHSPPCS